VSDPSAPGDAQLEANSTVPIDVVQPEPPSSPPLVLFGDEPDLVCVDDTCLPPSVEA
jgi:hypothetical protein